MDAESKVALGLCVGTLPGTGAAREQRVLSLLPEEGAASLRALWVCSREGGAALPLLHSAISRWTFLPPLSPARFQIHGDGFPSELHHTLKIQ